MKKLIVLSIVSLVMILGSTMNTIGATSVCFEQTEIEIFKD